MGQRRDRLDHRLRKQHEARRKNSRRKHRERLRRQARETAKAEMLGTRGTGQGDGSQE